MIGKFNSSDSTRPKSKEITNIMNASSTNQGIDRQALDVLVERIANRVVEKLVSRPRKRFVTLKELAEITGLGERTLARWKADGKIPFAMAGRRVLYDVDVVLGTISSRNDKG